MKNISKERGKNETRNRTFSIHGRFLQFSSVIAVAFLLFFSSCRKDDAPEVDMGYNYFPVDVGHWVIYDVTEIQHDEALLMHDTSTYQLKEYIESIFTDNEGNESLRIERFRRDSVTGPWVIKDVWTATLLTRRAEKVEENKRIIKLTFKPTLDKIWDGNTYNEDDEWEYSYASVDVPKIIGGLSFDSTCTVIQHDFRPGVLFHEYSTETYARNIGLVSTWRKILEINGIDTTDVVKGEELFMTVVDHM